MNHGLLTILIVAVSSAALSEAARAQLISLDPRPVTGARLPALSPDGKRLAFVYRGDVWIAPTKGGHATPLTQHVEADSYPLFSPDGQWVAFASRRNANWDIYAVPADGGTPRQLTWHGGNDIPQGWSPDGKQILLASKRDSPNYGIFAVNVQSLRTDLLCEDYAVLNFPGFAPDGKRVAYGRYGFHWTRPRYTGSAAAQIWLLDLETGKRRPVTTNGHQFLWPKFLPDGKRLVAVTVGESTPSSSSLDAVIPRITDNPLRTPNLWAIDLEGRATQLTTFAGGGVRWPTVASKAGDIVFEYEGDLYLLTDARKKKPQKLRLLVASDEKQTTRRREKLTKEVTEAEPSPDGKTFAFGLRGDIWTVAVEKPKGVAARNAEFARRLTDWVGEDSEFAWAHDGKKLYFTSDREMNSRLYELDLTTLKARSLWDRPEDVASFRLSPDGKQIGLWVAGREGGLHLLTLTNNAVRRLVKAPGPQWRGHGGGDFAWSPDMKWIAYTRRGESGAWNIWIMPVEGGNATNVTRLYAHHSQPAWSPDGKYLFFQSTRDGDGLYALPLRRESARISDVDLKFEKTTNAVEVTIDFDDIARRIRKLSGQNPQGDLMVTPDGQILFVSDGDIWSVGYDGKETKRLTTGSGKGGLRLSRDGKKAFFLQGGELYTMAPDGKNVEKVTFTAEWERDVRAERQAAFNQFWHSYARGFYDANFHGRDWEAIRRRYEPLLDAQDTPDEFATLLHMMIGELESSHSEVTPAPSGAPAPVTPHLGFSIDYTHRGPGIRVRDVPEGAPGTYRKTRIRPGEYVLAVNGQEVAANERLYEIINDRQDREYEFLVNTNADRKEARTVRYKVLSQDEWNDLNYRARVARLRKQVSDKTGDRIGYLHMPAMTQKDQVQFEREAYEYVAGKEGIIIDVRFNSGGNIADTLIDWLERKPYGYLRPRDGEREPAPRLAWEKPIVVLINEHSYSNGEIFPYAIRSRGLGKLVGMPTPGYVIWTYGLRLVDGTGARMPETGFYRLDGTPQENRGEQPDIRVPLSPDDWLAGRDPQLDQAIELFSSRR